MLLPQNDLGSARSAAEAERSARQDATAAVAKLEGVIASVRQEMAEAQEAADQVGPPDWPLGTAFVLRQQGTATVSECGKSGVEAVEAGPYLLLASFLGGLPWLPAGWKALEAPAEARQS
jgi:hypothetical protein